MPPPALPPSTISLSLRALYEEAGGAGWRAADNWLHGDPCADRWYGLVCCPVTLPIYRELDRSCTSARSGKRMELQAVHRSRQCIPQPPHEGANTTSWQAPCVIVAIDLSRNSLNGTLRATLLHQLPFVQALRLNGNGLGGALPHDTELMQPGGGALRRHDALAGALASGLDLDATHALGLHAR